MLALCASNETLIGVAAGVVIIVGVRMLFTGWRR